MAGAAGILAGAAYVRLSADGSALTAGLKAAQAQVAAFGQATKAVGAKMMSMAGAASLPFVGSVVVYAGFEKSMSRVKALTGATDKEFAALTAHAKFLGETTEYSSGQMADTMAALAQRSFSVNNILAATEPVMMLAASGGIELADAAGIASDIMGGMGIEAAELAKVVDVLALATTKSATTIPQLGEAFKILGPSAKSMGMSIEEATAALQILAESGIKDEMAGTAMRGLLETLKNPEGKEARQMLKDLGVEIDNGAGKFRKLDQIVGDMTAGLGKLSQVDASKALGVIFPNRQTTAIDILTRKGKDGSTGDEMIRQYTKRNIEEAPGTGKRISKTQLDNLWGAWKLIESAVEGVAITIGETLAPMLRVWGEAMTYGVGVINQLLKDNASWLPVLLKTVVAVGAVGAALVAAGTVIGVTAFAVGGLGVAWAAVTAAFSTAAVVIGAAISPIGAAAVSLGSLVAQFMTLENLGAIASDALGAVALGAITAAGAVAAVFEVVAGVASSVAGVVSSLVPEFSLLTGAGDLARYALIAVGASAVGLLVVATATRLASVAMVAYGAAAALTSAVLGGITAVAGIALRGIGLVAGAVRLLAVGFGVLTGVVSGALGLLLAPWKLIPMAIGAVTAAVGVMVPAIVAGVAALMAPISLVGIALGALPALIVVGGAAFLAFTDAGRKAVGALGSMFKGFVGNLAAWFGGLAESVGEAFREFGDALALAMSGIADDFKGAFKGITDAVSGGDLQLAGKIGMLGLRSAWLQGTDLLRLGWDQLCEYMVSTFSAAAAMVGKIMNSRWADWETYKLTVQFAAEDLLNPGIAIGDRARKAEEAKKNARTAALAEVAQKETAANLEVDETNRLAKEARDAGTRANALAGQEAIRKARADLDEAIKAAAALTNRSALERLAEMPRVAGLKEMPTPVQVQDAADRVMGGRVGGESAGTFDAAVLRFMGGNDSPAQETARKQTEQIKKAEEQLETLKRILDVLKDNTLGVVYGP